MKRGILKRKGMGVGKRGKNRLNGRLGANKTILTADPKLRKRRKKGEITKLKERLEALQKQVVIKLYGTLCYTHMPKATDTMTKQLGHMPWARAELSQTCIYDYRFTRIQCGQCNGFGQGMSMTARMRMAAEGVDLDEMWALNLATKGKQHKKSFYLDKIAEYEALL